MPDPEAQVRLNSQILYYANWLGRDLYSSHFHPHEIQ